MRVLALVNQESGPPGVFADVVRGRGHELDEWLVAADLEPPRPLGAYEAAIALGGSMNVDEEEANPWLGTEKAALTDFLEQDVPVLGVCLGAQLLADVAGGRVFRSREPEIGWCEVELTLEAADDPLFSRLPTRFAALQWHSYAFSLPPGGVPLARSPVSLQAFRVGTAAWGIQFHAEATREALGYWISHFWKDPDAVRLGFDRDRARRELEANIDRWNRLGADLCGRFLTVAETRARAAVA